MRNKKSFSLIAVPPAEKGLDAKIEFRTNDTEIYKRVVEYIDTQIDAERWRRYLHEVKHIAIKDED